MMELKETMHHWNVGKKGRENRVPKIHIHSYLSHIYVHTCKYTCVKTLIVYERYITFNIYMYKHVNRDKINVFPSAVC